MAIMQFVTSDFQTYLYSAWNKQCISTQQAFGKQALDLFFLWLLDIIYP